MKIPKKIFIFIIILILPIPVLYFYKSSSIITLNKCASGYNNRNPDWDRIEKNVYKNRSFIIDKKNRSVKEVIEMLDIIYQKEIKKNPNYQKFEFVNYQINYDDKNTIVADGVYRDRDIKLNINLNNGSIKSLESNKKTHKVEKVDIVCLK